ncbi:hypothetical protein, partial [Paenibacillus fonticola]|uniref:hypothetical protein n=1 Tax=Paenibacillus fonticola TaxID=379896 RepID=UPI000477F49F
MRRIVGLESKEMNGLAKICWAMKSVLLYSNCPSEKFAMKAGNSSEKQLISSRPLGADLAYCLYQVATRVNVYDFSNTIAGWGSYRVNVYDFSNTIAGWGSYRVNVYDFSNTIAGCGG